MLRKRDYPPILFNFEVPATRDTLLARMARFVVAELTDPSSIPKELETIIPTLAVPVQPLLEGASRPHAMFKDYWKYDWVINQPCRVMREVRTVNRFVVSRFQPWRSGNHLDRSHSTPDRCRCFGDPTNSRDRPDVIR
jgi:hypothetical protein